LLVVVAVGVEALVVPLTTAAVVAVLAAFYLALVLLFSKRHNIYNHSWCWWGWCG
jgi:hypothetical protein